MSVFDEVKKLHNERVGGADNTASPTLVNRNTGKSVPVLTPDESATIRRYEAMPNYNVFQRLFDKDKRETYKRKQAMAADYNSAKNKELEQKIGSSNTLQTAINDDALQKAITASKESGTNLFKQNIDPKAWAEVLNAKYGVDKNDVQRYLTTLSSDIGVQQAEEGTRENPVVENVRSSAQKAAGGVKTTVNAYWNRIAGQTDPTKLDDTLVRQSNKVRETTKQMIDENTEGTGNKIAQGAYDVGMGVLDMGVNAAMTGGRPLGLFYTSSYADTYTDAKNRGLTDAQASRLGTIAGAIEAGTEAIPFGTLKGLFKGGATEAAKSSVKNTLVKGILKEMGQEAVQEGASEWANDLADRFIAGDLSNYVQSVENYVAQGMTEEEAKKQASSDLRKRVGYSALIGGISGGFMAGGAGALGAVAGNYNRVPVLEQTQTEETTTSENKIPVLEKTQDANSEQKTTPAYQEGLDPLGDVQRKNAQTNSHTPQQLQTIEEYNNAQDDKILTWVERKRTGQKSLSQLPVATENNSVAEYVKSQTGIDITGNKVCLNESTLNHLQNNHYGTTVKSPMSDSDLARIGYVVAKPDEVVVTGDTTTATRLKDNSYAPKIIMRKRIDGHYYIVEAVTDAKTKQDVVVTAFIEEVGKEDPKIKEMFKGAYQAHHGSANPSAHALSDLENSSSNLNLPQEVNSVNNSSNEINLTERKAGETGPVPAAAIPTSSLFNDSIANNEQNVNNSAQMQETLNSVATQQPIEGNYKESSFANDTLVNKTDAPEELKQQFINNKKLYRELSNKETAQKAADILANNSLDDAIIEFRRLLSTFEAEAVPLGYNLSNELTKAGRIQEAVQITDDLDSQLTKGGQFSQAVVITMLNGNPEGAKQYLLRKINKLNKEGSEKYGKKWHDFSLTEQELQSFDALEPGDKEGIQRAYQEVFSRIAKEYPTTFVDKLLELRRMAMLLNFRTLVRNESGNMLLRPLRWTGDRVAALGEGVYSLIDPNYQRTQSLNPLVKKVYKDTSNLAWDKVKDDLIKTSKYDDASDAVRGKQMFKGKEHTSKLGQWYDGVIKTVNNAMGKDIDPSTTETLRNLTYHLLELSDNKYLQKNFESRMASYLQAQNITSIENIPEEAYLLATQEALKATFHDDTKLSQALSEIRKKGGVAGELILPFVKTPANIAMRTLDYSPVGLAKGFYDLFRAKGNHTQISQAMTEIGQSVVGSTAIFLGMALAKSGIIQGALSDDKDEAAFQKQQGVLPYSINIDGIYYTYDWALPAAAPLLFGAVLNDALNEESVSLGEALKKGGIAVADSWLQLSPLQNLQDIFGGYNSPANNVFDTLASSPLSWIPSQLGAIARTVDPAQRVTYDNSSYGTNLLNQAKAKIPVLSKTLPQAYDTWGNEVMRQNSTGQAAFANIVNPGQLGNANVTALDPEIQRLYNATGDKSVYPTKAEWSYKINNENIKLNGQQYSDIQRIMGQTAYSLADALINSEAYQTFSDDVRADLLSDLFSFASAMAKGEVLGYDVEGSQTYQKAYQVYKQYGAEGLANYYGLKQRATDLQSDTMSEDKAMVNALAETNMDDAEKGSYLIMYKGNKLSNRAKLAAIYGQKYVYQWYALQGDKGSTSKNQQMIALMLSGYSQEDKEILENLIKMKDDEVKALLP